MKSLRVDELMRECQAATISESALLRDAAETLVVNNISVLIATDSEGAIAGLISEAAIIRHLMATPNRAETVSGILSRHIETVRPNASVSSVLHLFRSSCHAVVPVVSETNHVIGLLHRTDVVKMLLADTVTDDASSAKHTQKPHFLDRNERPTTVEKDVPLDEADE